MLKPQRIAEAERQTAEFDLDLSLIRWQRQPFHRRGTKLGDRLPCAGSDDRIHEHRRGWFDPLRRWDEPRNALVGPEPQRAGMVAKSGQHFVVRQPLRL